MPGLKLQSADSFVPPDVNNPPFYIPLKNIDSRYNVIQELGKGSFGSVTLAETLFDMKKSSQEISSMYPETLMDQCLIRNVEQENWYYKKKGIVAIKTMMNRLSTLHDYTRVREIKFILQIPAHKNLVTVYEMFIDNSLYHLHIVMECMEQNIYQLMNHRKRRVFSLPTLRSILFQILAGIKHIHDHDFFHRDIKPENILISPSHRYFSKKWLEDDNYPDNYVVKLADYGLARHVNNRSPYTTYVSTRWYRSPEILLRKGYYSKPLDIWAYGCVVVELATFSPLFPGSDETDQIWRILDLLGSPDHSTNGKEHFGGTWPDCKSLYQALNYEFPYVEGKTIRDVLPNPQLEDLYDVVTSCLKWNPNDRASANELCALPYFKEYVIKEAKMAKADGGDISNGKEGSMIASKLGINSLASNQWSRILSGLPPKADIGIVPNFNNPQKALKIEKVNHSILSQEQQEHQKDQQQKRSGVASWFKFSTNKNHVNVNPNEKAYGKALLTDAIDENNSNKNRRIDERLSGEIPQLQQKQQLHDHKHTNHHHHHHHHHNQQQQQQQQEHADILAGHNDRMDELNIINHANNDNEVFTIELDDSMETMTGSQQISKELNEKVELYQESSNSQLEINNGDLDINDVSDAVQMDQENYRIHVLNEYDTDENLADEIQAIDEDENTDNIVRNSQDLENDEDDDPDSLLNYYQEMMAKKLPPNGTKGHYTHSNGVCPTLSDRMAIDDSIDLQEQIPRNLLERAVQQRVLDCLLDSSEQISQNLIQNSNSHNHSIHDGLSF